MHQTAQQHRILVVADRACPCPDVISAVRTRVGQDGEVLVIAPALNTRLRHWVSDSDDAVHAAHERLALAIGALRAAGVQAEGAVGDADPIVAIDDALARYAATELVIATAPAERANWLEKDLVRRAGERWALPVEHVGAH